VWTERATPARTRGLERPERNSSSNRTRLVVTSRIALKPRTMTARVMVEIASLPLR
jgi:hypothetical protein